MTTDDDDPVAVTYTDPRGGTRTVRHAALATVELTVRRPGQGALTLSSRRGAYEFGTHVPLGQYVNPAAVLLVKPNLPSSLLTVTVVAAWNTETSMLSADTPPAP